MANFFEQFHDAPEPAAPSGTANFFSQFQPQEQSGGVQTVPGKNGAPTRVIMDMGKKPTPDFNARFQDEAKDKGTMDAGARGIAKGVSANFVDELRGLVEASGANPNDPASLGQVIHGALKYFGGDQDAEARYNTAVNRERQLNKDAETQHPVASTVGEIAGAVALPIGAIGEGAMLARAGKAALVGSGYGTLAGIGDGEGAADTLKKAAIGGAGGFVLGGASVPLVAGVEAAGRGIGKLAQPIITTVRGGINPDAEAARRVLGARARDSGTTNPGMTQAEFDAAKASGSPVINADMGGETTQALARSAANTSPEGRAALEAVTSERYAEQNPRIATWLKEKFNFPEPGAALDKIHADARKANKPAYDKAYREGPSIWDDGLEQFSQAPAVQQAIRAAFLTGRNRAALEGHAPIKNPFVLNRDTGILELQPGAAPNLQFWDHVKRNLDKMGAEGQVFSKALRDHLDDVVKSYAEARSGAAKYFGAEDALEAGAKFATMSGRDAIATAQARKGLALMKPPERKLFETGFVSNLLAKVETLKDGQDVVKNIFNSEHARNQIRLAVGDTKANELEAKLLTERAMNGVKNAIQGNSTTARQWVERGMAGGALGIGGTGAYETDPKKISVAALVGALAAGSKHIDTKVARRVAEMLASNDPKILDVGTQLVARSSMIRSAFRKLELPAARVGGEQSGSLPALQSLSASRANDQPEIQRPNGQQ